MECYTMNFFQWGFPMASFYRFKGLGPDGFKVETVLSFEENRRMLILYQYKNPLIFFLRVL